MAECLMPERMYKELSTKIWHFNHIERRFHHGDGPLFAYSLYIKKLKVSFKTYWVYICNEIAHYGASIQITSRNGRGYNCELSRIKEIGINGSIGFIHITDILLSDHSRRDLMIQIKLPSSDEANLFSEMVNFFGF